MVNKLISLLFILCTFLGGYAVLQEDRSLPPIMHSDDECVLQNTVFQDGEKITYKAYYNWKFIWIPAGEVTFTVREEEAFFHFEVVGKTYPSYDSFFKVDDHYYSKVDKETLQPVSFRRRIEEGKYIRYDSISFDRENQKLTEFIGKSIDATRAFHYDSHACMQDLVSVLYHLRNRDTDVLKEGDHVPLKIFFDKEFFQPAIIYEGKKEKEIKNLGTYEVLHIRPELIAGEVFEEGTYMDVWVSADKNHIPLLLESPVSIGSVKVVLKEYTGLRYVLE